MRLARAGVRRMGDIFDFDNYTDPFVDVVTSIADNLPDAQKLIGGALKFIAPIVSMWPGIGTAVSVALSLAGSLALGQRLDAAVLDAASNAIPPGLPRVGFNSAVRISQDLLAGRPAWESVIDACRSTASTVGGERAVQAFDTGLAVARGQGVSDATIRLARAQVAQGGTEAAAAFDAGVAVSKGEGADEVLLLVARDYIAASGNPLALAAFDTGVALAHGAALQEAGFAGLQSLVYGNDSGERAVRFLEKMTRAAREGRSVWAELVGDLSAEIAPFIGKVDVGAALAPVVEAMRIDPTALAWPAQALANAWGIAEPIVRAAQAVMRNGTTPDETLVRDLRPVISSIGKKGVTDAEAAAAAAAWAARLAQNPSVPEICLRAEDARARGSVAAPNLTAQCAEYRRLHPVRTQSAGLAVSGNVPMIKPSTIAVPFAPPRAVAPIVQAANQSARTGVAGDVALGGVIGLAGLALFWWSRS